MALVKADIIKEINEGRLCIEPILEDSQFGEITVDLRLGYDFLVSIQGRIPVLDVSGTTPSSSIRSLFQSTRRLIGESFVLHPHQTVVTTTLEYVKLPTDMYVVLGMRSSYSRLGLTMSTIAQPGYVGCLSVEITNNNNNPIQLTVGARVVQARFERVAESTNYFHSQRKYSCSVRPELSGAGKDSDLLTLRKIAESL